MANSDSAGEPKRSGVKYSGLLHPIRLQDLAREWLMEDTPNFDYGGFVVGDKVETAVLVCKSAGVLAGVPFFDAIFNGLDCSVQWNAVEGDFLQPICFAATVIGRVRNILLGERVALNCLCRASGIATYARRLADLGRERGWHGEIAGTRKTTPGFRMVEKYSLLVGGIATHRYDLSSMVMLKDNHIWSAGNVTQAVKDARTVCGFSTKVEVECRSLEEALEAARAGADIIMLDNFEPQALHKMAETLKKSFPSVLVESSGGINVENIVDFMGTHVDVISLSHTTQGYDVVDFSLKINAENRNLSNPLISLQTQ